MKIKLFYLVIVLSIVSLDIYSQENIVNIEHQNSLNPFNIEDNDIYYFKDVNNLLDKYVGTWIFDDGTHYIKIVVTKHLHQPRGNEFYNDNDFEDKIWIAVQYKLNGVEKYNTDGGMGGNKILDENSIWVSYREPSLISCYRKKRGNLELEHSINSSSVEQLTWARTNAITEGWAECPDGTDIDNSDFLIPANLVLIKQ